MSWLKSFLVKLVKFFGRQTADLAESIVIGLFSIAAFVALFWFDEWWKSISMAIAIFFVGFLVSLAIGWLRGEK
ncbi:hypothetical protein [Serratia entomophila]|uniref:Uncharacterized protein n=1 Tax=Serratia entomophila TaxID=42906 RepID=A0ABY5CQM2_9GAMM|nr:hypothetical protein [Serratia entomophila]USV00421.1 hypothetical protein KFQ06_20740 [Serratia entomophila]CAI0697589.1 Uncharacterised protein [Serratia entomophila]CAI0761066.1 Uncharacterised protein [Serratia entomophila]CAI0991974.1 Uncharacterised protein [Serratia entomophila]CAI1002867.1 Uncharacterised protein [Serratia entomophila]